MNTAELEQGSQAWLDARVGVVTASNFDRLITPKTGKPSTQFVKFAYEMLAEETIGRSLSDASSIWMERGTELEDEARAWYEWEHNVTVVQVGLIKRADGKVGCSPDGLVGDDGLLEIKCPSAAVHMAYLLGAPGEEYTAQTQGQLWVTGRKWVDFVSFCPGFPTVCIRLTRDEEFIGKLSEAVEAFLVYLDTQRTRLASYVEAGRRS